MNQIKIPISEAKAIAKKYKQNYVIVIGIDTELNYQQVATYGNTLEECSEAAKIGNKIKELVLKWPKEKCNAKPKHEK